MRKRFLLAGLLCTTLALPTLADVTYEQETKMGGFLKVLTFGRGVKSKTYVSGHKMRTEEKDEIRIVDVDAEKIYTIDKKKKTYSVMTFEEMKEMLRAAREQADAVVEEARAERERAREEGAGEEPEVTMSADVKITPTGNRKKIQGYDCEQVLMELSMTATNEETKEQGTLGLVGDLWMTKDVAGLDEITAFHRAMAAKLGTTALGQPASGGDAQQMQFSAGLQKMAEEMKKLDGFVMAATYYFGTPEAARAEALEKSAPEESEKKKKGGGIGGLFKKANPFGGKGEEEEGGEDEGEKKPEGGVLFKMTMETKKYETGSVDPSLFRVPEGYRVVGVER